MSARALRSAVAITLALVLALGLAFLFGWGRKGDRSSATVDTIVASTQGGRGDSARGGVLTVPPPDSTTTAPPTTPIYFPYPASILAADSAAGQRIYRREAGCLACHGGRGEGVAGLGSSLADSVWARGEGSLSLIYSTIRDGISGSGGRGAMPALAGRHSPREMFQVAAYVYTLSHPGATVADSSALPAGAPQIARPPADTSRN